MMSLSIFLMFGWLGLAGNEAGPAVGAQEPPKAETSQTKEAEKPKDVPAPAKKTRRTRAPQRQDDRTYMGREIADVMSYLGAEWLFRPEREEEEQPDRMLDALKIAPGDTVADVGAGAGYTTMRLARRVGPKGKVLATDIQPQMIAMLERNVRQVGLTNVKPILCTETDPKLPEGAVDLILMVDVYHECSAPVATLRGLRKALKPGGRLVLVEFRAEDPNVPIKPEHKMSVDQARKEVEPQGFTFKETLEFLPWQHIIVFEKPKSEDASKASPAPAESKESDGQSSPATARPTRRP